MTGRRRALACAAAVAIMAAPGAGVAQPGDPSFEGRLRIGGTGILCVKEPCPRIGVTAAGTPGAPRFGRPMFAGPTPPPLVGAKEDLDRVRAAWTIDGCLIVEGRFSRPPRLEVRRVIGACARDD
ncbi:hypothetical protein [Methylopila musalis]